MDIVFCEPENNYFGQDFQLALGVQVYLVLSLTQSTLLHSNLPYPTLCYHNLLYPSPVKMFCSSNQRKEVVALRARDGFVKLTILDLQCEVGGNSS